MLKKINFIVQKIKWLLNQSPQSGHTDSTGLILVKNEMMNPGCNPTARNVARQFSTTPVAIFYETLSFCIPGYSLVKDPGHAMARHCTSRPLYEHPCLVLPDYAESCHVKSVIGLLGLNVTPGQDNAKLNPPGAERCENNTHTAINIHFIS